MIVTFVSQCQKRSLNITRQVLDAYANRIGERTWQTVITQEGLNAVRMRLAKTARKTTAVACHRMRGTSRTELVWIVGNRRQFDEYGNVPVNRTSRDLLKEDLENDWKFLPLIKVLVALAALFHDFGKSSDHFQKMLANTKHKDPIRHEWISLLLFREFARGKTDENWLNQLAQLKAFSPKERKDFCVKLIAKAKPANSANDFPFDDELSDLATWIGWLIVTHHKLPQLDPESYQNGKNISESRLILEDISRKSGYLKIPDYEFVPDKDWKFSEGLPLLSEKWCKDVARWATKAFQVLPLVQEAQPVQRALLVQARLALVLGDHNYSSKDRDENWKTDLALYANTDREEDGSRLPKQRLDEHLTHVAGTALKVAHLLPAFEKELRVARDVRALRKPSPPAFAWQNKAVQSLRGWRKDHDLSKQGFFAINMASTGRGKTFANAKVMSALSADGGLRYNLALGLRTLTLQTGDEYRDKLKLDNTELAVLIGSAAVRYLHEQRENEISGEDKANEEYFGSESARSLTANLEVIYEGIIPEDIFSTVLRDAKSKSLLYAPVLVSTIDHLMPATEATKGGRQLLPTLRLMSADLVIDEVDDFDQKDLPAISRLVHMAGMLGRKVMISSATIPPAIAQGLFHAYQAGWELFAATRGRKRSVTVFWLDEFGNSLETLADEKQFGRAHQDYVKKRLKNLQNKARIKRRARIFPINEMLVENRGAGKQQVWFANMLDAALVLHHQHGYEDAETGKRMSIGVIRVANVDPCIKLTQYLLDCELPEDTDIRVMCYHARQVLLLRSEQEKHLDRLLDRKGNRLPQNNPVIKQHLRRCNKPNLVFILVATPVEEVGRDHDLDWAVIEPSSMRSIIQMAGRVVRHRSGPVSDVANLALPEYNLKGFIGHEKYVFRYPGYESKDYPLESHSLFDLMNERALAEKVDASPRITCPAELRPRTRLVDLEHQVLQDVMTNDDFRPQTVKGWVHGAYYLSSLSQMASPFRRSEKDEIYKLHINEDSELELRFADKEYGKEPSHLHIASLEPMSRKRVWLSLDYQNLIDDQRRRLGYSVQRACEFLGEVRLADNDGEQHFTFIPELGFHKERHRI